MNSMMGVGMTIVNFGNQLISFLVLGAYIAGLVICILNKRLSTSMIMCIVGFGGLIGVWVLKHLIGALYGLGSIGPEGSMLVSFLDMFIYLCEPIALGVLVWGLFRAFADVSERLGLNRGGGKKASKRRRDEEEEEEEEEERPVRKPKNPGSRDVQR